jgi:hypothetical protein
MLVQPFKGGTKLMLGAAVVGVLGLAGTGVGFLTSPKQTFFSYLVAFMYWVGISMAALLLLAINHAAHAKWITLVRRPIEAVVAVLPLFVVLIIPLAFGMEHLFPRTWADARLVEVYGEVEAHHLHHKHAYLNVPFFWVRQVIYLGLFLVASFFLLKWSFAQDVHGGYEFNRKSRILSSGFIPFLGLGISFFSFDWLMSLTPLWQSTIFGVYYFSGSFLGAIAVVTIASILAKGPDLFGAHLTRHHYHNLGKLLLAFTAFWAYIGFSQYLLIWIANIPEENPYYVVRSFTDWRNVSVFLIVGHFVLPFFLLLPRTTKLVMPILLGAAFWLLFVHFVDIHWMVMPALHDTGPAFSIFDLTAFVGVGGLAVAVGVWRLQGRYTVPVKDPYLPESLRYVQP